MSIENFPGCLTNSPSYSPSCVYHAMQTSPLIISIMRQVEYSNSLKLVDPGAKTKVPMIPLESPLAFHNPEEAYTLL